LRDNGEVRKRLDGLGGQRDAKPACSEGAATVEAVCTCLLESANDLMNPLGAKSTCGVVNGPNLGSPALAVVVYGVSSDEPGERRYALVAHDGTVHRVVAELGHDYAPGAFGVDNRLGLLGGERRKVDAREVVVVRSKATNHDSNLAGLEICEYDVDQETVCALGDATRATRCVTVPMQIDSGCGAGVEPDPEDADARALLEERKPTWSKAKVTLRWSVDQEGYLVVKRATGDAKLVSPGTLGKHPLFSSDAARPAAK